MTELINAQNKILGYLTRLNDMVSVSNSAGQSTLTKVAEKLISELFSIILNTQLTNTNLEISNFPAVDLHSTADRLAIQVTSNDASEKVIHTLETFLRHDLDIHYSRLLIVTLTNKKFDLRRLNKNLKEVYRAYGKQFGFQAETDLLNLNWLYGKICNDLDIDQTLKVAELLKKYFDEYVGQSDLAIYYDFLKEQFFQTVMDDQKGMTLNSIYVEPAFGIISHSANKTSPQLLESRDHNFIPRADISIHQLLNGRFADREDHHEMFAHPHAKVTIVLGYPGQGKTSMCNKLLFDLLTTPHEKNIFYLKLRNITDTRALIDNPFNVIYAELETELGDTFNKEMLKNSITILDGLDELYMKDDLTAEHIETFVKGVITETSKFGSWEVLITTRHGYINFQKLFKENYIGISLSPLNISKQLSWIEKYRNFHPESWLDRSFLKKINNYKTNGFERHFLSELINQPLLLYIIASLDKPVDELANRTEIYNMLFNQIIERKYSKDGQIENLKQLTQNDLRCMLQEIAFLIFLSGKGYLTHDEVLKAEALEDFIEKIGDSHLSKSLKGILISFYFKEVKDPASDHATGIEFFHKSLQEYLTAERITENIFHTFLNKDQHQQYILKKGPQMLVYLNSILGVQQITSEIWEFISNLIQKKELDARNELAKRMSMNIDYFYEKDFISEVKFDDINTQLKIVLTLNFFWRILSACNTMVDYMLEKSWVNKHFSIQMAIDSYEISIFGPKGLSYQTIDDVKIVRLQIQSDNLRQTTFKDCFIENLRISETKMYNLSFFECHLSHFTLDDSEGNITFGNCEFYYANFFTKAKNRLTFRKCIFQERFYIDSEEDVNVLFEECTFSEDAILDMKGKWTNYTFKNSVIERIQKNPNGERYDTINTTIKNTYGGIRFAEDENQFRLFE